MKTSQFSEVTKKYLCRYYEILDEMIQKMTEVELTNSISHNFIVQMIPHHEAAIRMSENILQYTTFLPLQQIAQNIISEQTKSIQNMEQALERCSLEDNSSEDLFLYQMVFEEITHTMFRQMQRAVSTNNINADFMREMIPHHRGAIRMSENALRYPLCPELIPILDDIITSQSQGIRKMECLLRRMEK